MINSVFQTFSILCSHISSKTHVSKGHCGLFSYAKKVCCQKVSLTLHFKEAELSTAFLQMLFSFQCQPLLIPFFLSLSQLASFPLSGTRSSVVLLLFYCSIRTDHLQRLLSTWQHIYGFFSL